MKKAAHGQPFLYLAIYVHKLFQYRAIFEFKVYIAKASAPSQRERTPYKSI